MIERLHDLHGLTDIAPLADALAACGLSRAACREKAARLAQAAGALRAASGGDAQATIAFFVPGRIELLGKHTDYAGGSSLIAAVERGFSLVARPRRDNRLVVIDAATGERAELAIDPDLVPRAGHWSNYPATVARRIARNFPGARQGAEMALVSDLPPAAGMSSSSALMVAVFLALAEINRLAETGEYRANIATATDLAGYLGTVENGQSYGTLAGDRGVGTFGGSEDHTAILCSRPGQVRQYAYCPVRFERSIAMPPGRALAVAASGVAAEKTGDARERYNRASRLALLLAQRWREATGGSEPHLAAILAASPEAADRLRAIARSGAADSRRALRDRLEHFVLENRELLPAAGDALAAGDLIAFGRLVDRSQEAAERLLGNQVRETCFLAGEARRLGADAASAFGAGFGGSVWAMLPEAAADGFLARWRESYHRQFPERRPLASFFLAGAGPAAQRVWSSVGR